MAEQIELASYNIDTSAVLKASAGLREAINLLSESQKQARKNGEDTSEEYVAQEAILKALQAEYRQNTNALVQLSAAQQSSGRAAAEQAAREELLNAALSQEVTTIEEARNQNKLLTQLRNTANASTEEGAAEIEELNAALDKNNDFIKENVSSLEQQKINVGNYGDSIKSALNDMNPFNQSITVFISNIQEAGGVMPFLSNGLKAVSQGIIGATRASLAFLATPIGAVVGAIGLALGLVVNALTGTQEGMDRMTAITRPLVAIFEVFQGILQQVGLLLLSAFDNPLESITKVYDYIKDKVIRQFEALYDIVVGIATLDFDQAEQGFTKMGEVATDIIGDVADVGTAIGDQFKTALELGEELDRLTKEYELTQIRNAELIPELNAQLREQNKIAEDITKSTAEREAAAAKTIALSQQINQAKREELGLEVAIAENEASRNDTTREELLELAKLRGQLRDADAQAAEQQTTQQNKLNTIRREQEQDALKAIQEQRKAEQEAADAAIKDQQEKLSLFEAEQALRIQNADDEVKLAEQVALRKKEILDAELEAKKLSETAYRTAILELDNDLELQRRELAEQRRDEEIALQLEQEKIREEQEANKKAEQQEIRAIEFEQELQNLIDEGATAFEVRQAQLDEQRAVQRAQVEAQQQKGLISEQLYQSRLAGIELQYAQDVSSAQEEIDRTLAEQKINISQSLIGTIGKIVGEQSAAGKALGLAQSLINTYQAITTAIASAPFPANVPAVTAASTTGFAAVKKIKQTKVPNAPSSSPSLGSDLVQLAKNQSNVSAVSASGNAAVQNQINESFESSQLSNKVADAVKEGSKQGTMEGSQEGMVQLSDNKFIQYQSTS